MNEKKGSKYLVLLIIQLLFIFATGMLSKDAGFAILVSLIGVIFNFLVSINIPIGFLFGVVYAITNGILAFTGGVYATAGFMIFLQAPMAVYSYLSWQKKKSQSVEIMKKMTKKQVMLMSLLMVVLGGTVYLIMKNQNGINVLFDTIFFVFSVSACLLLAFCYKNAYIVTFCSGAGGTLLWMVQMLQTGTGVSVAAFYFIVAVNSLIAITRQYGKTSQ